MKNIRFKKAGKEIKASIEKRCQELGERLEIRNVGLEEVLKDRKKVRAYMLRQSQGHMRYEYENPPIIIQNDILSEEVEEINQLCKRLYQLEQEISKLRLIQSHLSDEDEFELELKELIRYGFKID